ncbi:hypothetical protein GHT07_18960 [Caenimonas koreensis DSM 17982]|uniref:Uncharacterized protein n=1 Tax=Caenimonas koreensis DSM 17982 TaxID=1121255 RepID=A0A844BFX3_9BURK|nr:hypothetical protein [Caenimonas koreensis]MRD49361.1 hypothetical protein [Caenimonas koreensis DSM 17982]
MKRVHHGMNRADFDHIWIELVGEILHARRTGEVVYRHSLLDYSVRVNGRRKDTTRRLTAAGMALERLLNTPAANDDNF